MSDAGPGCFTDLNRREEHLCQKRPWKPSPPAFSCSTQTGCGVRLSSHSWHSTGRPLGGQLVSSGCCLHHAALPGSVPGQSSRVLVEQAVSQLPEVVRDVVHNCSFLELIFKHVLITFPYHPPNSRVPWFE